MALHKNLLWMRLLLHEPRVWALFGGLAAQACCQAAGLGYPGAGIQCT